MDLSDEKIQQLVQRNSKGLLQFEAVVESLPAHDLSTTTSGNWSVAATLAHLAFWDRFVEARWNDFFRKGAFEEIPDSVKELVNDAARDQWHKLKPEEAVRLSLEAARSVTRTIERLELEQLRAAVNLGRLAMLHRGLHWDPHLEEIRLSRESTND